MVLSMPADPGATPASRTAAPRAGSARTSPSTTRDRGPSSPPRSSSHPGASLPAPERRTDSTGAPVWTVTPRPTRARPSSTARLAVLPASDQKSGVGAPDAARSGAGARGGIRSRRMRLPGWWAAAMRTGKVAAALRSSTPPALMRGSARRSTTGRPRRLPTMSPTDRSPASPFAPGRNGSRSRATRSDSAGLRMPDRKSGHHRVGMPRLRPAGMDRSRPRAQREAPDAPTGTSDPVRPSSSQRPVASGRRARKASAARSTVRPANSVARSFPPIRSSASRTWTSGPGASPPGAPTSSQAAASPAMPPPTTATTGRRGRLTTARRGRPGGIPARRPPTRGAPPRPARRGRPGRR